MHSRESTAGGDPQPQKSMAAHPWPESSIRAAVPPDLPPNDREELLRHGARSLARRAVRDTSAYVMLFVALVLTTPVLRDQTILAFATILGCTVIGVARLHLSRSFDRLYDRAPLQWRRLFAVTTLGMACLWGSLCYAVAASYGLQLRSLMVMFATAAMTAGSVSSLGIDRRLLTGFLVLMLAPLALAAVLSKGPEGLTMSLVVTLYCIVLVREGRYQNRHYWTSIANLLRLRARSAELERARVQVEGESQAKSDFLARMSHEVRNPLNGVLGMTSLVLDTPLTQVQREYADTIRRSAESMLDVLNDVLDLSKIEAGRMTIESIDFDLQELVEDAGARVAAAANANGVELVVRIPPGFPRRLRGDSKRLREVLTNLATNAAKFTERGEVAIELELLRQDAASASVRLTVRDTGIGIARDRQEAVFQGFTQAEGSTSRRYGGTGLGLAIAKQLVTLMGGTLALDSEPGRGTTFRIDLELEKPPGAESGPAPGPDLAGFRILAADDNATCRALLAEQLRALGAEVECVPSGPDALDALALGAAGTRFDLVLVDSAMPEMSGLELASTIRADWRFSRTPIVLLLSSGGTDPAADARRLGISALVTKPIRSSLLADAVAQAVGVPSGSPRAAVAPGPEAASLSPLALRVLVADDHAVNRAVAARMCERMGVAADVVSNGHEAIDALMRGRYSAVLLDVEMPEMDGFEAAREIRRLERLHGGRIPVLALTGHVRPADLERCREAGMDDCLTKPLRPEELSAAIIKWCGQPRPTLALVPAVLQDPGPRAQVLNLEQLTAVAGNDAAFERMLRGEFLGSLPPLLEQAQIALAGKDTAALKAIAHRLKGSTRTMGGDAVGDACEALEEAAGRSDFDAASAALRTVCSEVDLLEDALRARDLAA